MLHIFLGQLQSKYHGLGYLNSDPLEFVHRYEDPWDQEAVALIAALLAYGNVTQIRRSVQGVLNRIHDVAPRGPAQFVRNLHKPAFRAAATRRFADFVHRFNRGPDVILIFEVLNRSWREHGSLGAHFMKHLDPRHPHIGIGLDGLIDDWREWAAQWRKEPSFSYFLTAPRDGSCCKRWCMFLRWMGRRDQLDPGLWGRQGKLSGGFPKNRFLRPDQLVIPLDTHTGRISQYLGLTSRRSLNWKAALEVTDSLRRCDPRDPVRYDFAISRLGILDLCQRKFRREICAKCDLLRACKYAAGAGTGIHVEERVE